MTPPTHAQPESRRRSDPADLYATLRSRFLTALTHTHTYSGRDDHGGTVCPPQSYERLAAWSADRDIDLLGMGSTYTPETIDAFHRFDGHQQDVYYHGPDAAERRAKLLMLQRRSTTRMLAEVNDRSRGRTCFYLDNETPKGRFGHMWWMGWHDETPAWHDFDQPFDRWMLTSDEALSDGDEPMAYERRPYAGIVAAQRARGALGIWAHPTSWWLKRDGRFISNLATEMPAHAFADGYLDGVVTMGYRADRPDYRNIWYALLDRGVRVPAFAEMDQGLSLRNLDARPGLYLTALRLDDASTPRLIAGIHAAQRGDTVVSSGPLADLTIDGVGLGGVVTSDRNQTHHARLEIACPNGQPLDHVRLVGREGSTIWSSRQVKNGTYDIDFQSTGQAGYAVLEALSDPDDEGRATRVAITSPIYLHPPGTGFRQPAVTELSLRAAMGTWADRCRFRIQSAAGEVLTTGRLSVNPLVERVPANCRVVLIPEHAPLRSYWLLTANPALRHAQRHLYRGRFRHDFPDLSPGQLPVEAWRLDDYEAALRSADLTLGLGDPAHTPPPDDDQAGWRPWSTTATTTARLPAHGVSQ